MNDVVTKEPPARQRAEDASVRPKEAFAALDAARRREPLPSIAARRAWLRALRDMARDTSEALARAVSEDFGHRSLHESKLAETWLSVSQLGHLLDEFEGWLEVEPRRVAPPFWFGRAELRAQPKGVVGIISPWNYPFMLAVEQLGGALAAGNRVLLKLSEHTPRSSGLLARELARRLPSDVVRVFTGGADEGAELTALPLDHLLFTGSHAVGRKVYEAAAKQLVPVTLELGGKSPAILHESYSVTRFAKEIISGKCFSAGQSCVSPDYLLVPRAARAEVSHALAARFAESYPTLVNNPDYTSLAGPMRRDRILHLLRDAVERGASVLELNPGQERFDGTDKLPLTLLFDVADTASVMQEEIFGPLLPIVLYDRLEDALAYVAARPRPLALYYFDDDPGRVERVLDGTISGGVTVNATLLHFLCDDLPRGATGASGFGAYHGRTSFEVFSHRKSVFRQSRVNAVDLLRPPYRSRLDWILRVLIGR